MLTRRSRATGFFNFVSRRKRAINIHLISTSFLHNGVVDQENAVDFSVVVANASSFLVYRSPLEVTGNHSLGKKVFAPNVKCTVSDPYSGPLKRRRDS